MGMGIILELVTTETVTTSDYDNLQLWLQMLAAATTSTVYLSGMLRVVLNKIKTQYVHTDCQKSTSATS
jgi:hypothetical protein